jgi:hypothetical protein
MSRRESARPVWQRPRARCYISPAVTLYLAMINTQSPPWPENYPRALRRAGNKKGGWLA